MVRKFAVWYMRPDFFRNGLAGFDWCKAVGKTPDPSNLEKTHIFLKDVEIESGDHIAVALELLFRQMQGEVLSPNGEAWSLIEEKGLWHTSMSVGDIAVHADRCFIVDTVGFKEITHASSSSVG